MALIARLGNLPARAVADDSDALILQVYSECHCHCRPTYNSIQDLPFQ